MCKRHNVHGRYEPKEKICQNGDIYRRKEDSVDIYLDEGKQSMNTYTSTMGTNDEEIYIKDGEVNGGKYVVHFLQIDDGYQSAYTCT